MKANNLDIKHVWVKKIRQLIQDTYFGTSKVSASLPSLSVPNQGSNRSSKYTTSQRSSRDFDDAGSLDESIENMERGSLASFGSGGTTDSEGHHRVSTEHACLSSVDTGDGTHVGANGAGAGDSIPDIIVSESVSENNTAVENLQKLVKETETLSLSKS